MEEEKEKLRKKWKMDFLKLGFRIKTGRKKKEIIKNLKC